MHTFNIEYLTRNTGSSCIHQNVATTQVHNNDGLLTSNVSNYLNTSLNLEDVYSVINKDTGLNGTSKHACPLVANSIYKFHNGIDSPHVSQQDIKIDSESSTTPLSSPLERETPSPTESGFTPLLSTVGKGTPSPNKDSGIESDTSPVSYHSTENVSKALRDLEKTANSVKSSSTCAKKPSHSYIALIALAILHSRDRRSTLGDIYRHIMDTQPFYNNQEKAWRNSIRYNLSINECFTKAGKDVSGKGNLWAIHPACVEDFLNGDYRRRQARRRARRTLKGLGVEDASAPSESNLVRVSAYQTMTPSVVTYHPYSAAGLIHHQQQMTNYAHAYIGHQTLPTSSYYNSVGRYPPAQYPYVGYALPTSNYSQHDMSRMHRGYSGLEFTNMKGYETTDNTKYEQFESANKYYMTTPQENATAEQNNVPSNNNIVIS